MVIRISTKNQYNQITHQRIAKEMYGRKHKYSKPPVLFHHTRLTTSCIPPVLWPEEEDHVIRRMHILELERAIHNPQDEFSDLQFRIIYVSKISKT